jgi:hypothetical protein
MLLYLLVVTLGVKLVVEKVLLLGHCFWQVRASTIVITNFARAYEHASQTNQAARGRRVDKPPKLSMIPGQKMWGGNCLSGP